jgi:glucose-1-phosphate cytidylyltransferase
MKVVILCGGLGTRLKEETEYRPKPMVPIGGRPILWHIMKTYAHFGHKDFILCLGYKGEVIKEYFLNYKAFTSDFTLKLGRHPQIDYHNDHDEEDWCVTLLETGADTMTGGRLKRAIAHIPDDTFLCTYGDGLTDSNINDSIRMHQSSGKLATLTAVHPAGRFGELGIEQGRVTSFDEKPEAGDDYINGGFFVFDRRIEGYLSGDSCILEREPLEKLASERQVNAFQHEGYWQCMDTYREQQLLEKLWVSGRAPWKVW